MPAKPPLSLPSNAPTPAIAAEINHATEEQHEKLNKLIIQRIALALPPHTNSLEAYGRGLALYARIYYAFESVAHKPLSSNEGVSRRIFVALDNLYVKGLRRSTRLENDLAHVFKITGVDVRRTVQDYQDKMADRIRHDLCAKPHLLVAYTWVMYMAIFSGGRWIRKQLLSAGTGFWNGQDCPEDTESNDGTVQPLPGFMFLSFDGDQDGQDIKNAFKAQLAATEKLLTVKERQDIVGYAQDIYDDCIVLVEKLDGVVEQQMARKHRSRRSLWFWLCIISAILVVVYLYRNGPS